MLFTIFEENIQRCGKVWPRQQYRLFSVLRYGQDRVLVWRQAIRQYDGLE